MHQLVATRSDLEAAAKTLEAAPVLYVDTEFESNRQERTLCLLQISSGDQVYLVDTLRLKDLGPLEPALARPGVEWVLHAGQQDVDLLIESLRLGQAPVLFDTQVAWALQSPEPSVSLAYLKYKLLGVRSSKGHQTDDWKRRPLPDSQLAYAAEDIEHLPLLRSRLSERARALGRLDIVRAASRDAVWPEPEPPPRVSLDSFRNAWQLDPHSQAGLRFIIDWYNGLDAHGRAAAPEPKALLSIAMRMPETAAELGRIKGVPRRWAEKHGEWIAGRLMRASAEAATSDFVPIDPPPYATFEEIRLDAWLASVRAEVCETLEVAPELALPGKVLRHMRADLLVARHFEAAIEQLAGWRRDLLMAPLTELARRRPPPLERDAS
jgi:ribonuclease D